MCDIRFSPIKVKGDLIERNYTIKLLDQEINSRKSTAEIKQLEKEYDQVKNEIDQRRKELYPLWFDTFKQAQNDVPQPIDMYISNIDCSNIKFPIKPEIDWMHKNYHGAWEIFYQRKSNAKSKFDSQNDKIIKEFEGYTFYIYKDDLYYFDTQNDHGQEEQQLLIKKYYFNKTKKFENLKKEIEIMERLVSEPEINREPIPEDVRFVVWRRDQGKCVKCGRNEKLEYDHMIPVSKGGSNTERNIQLLCEKCNREKADKI